jgi:hypothetical protein
LGIAAVEEVGLSPEKIIESIDRRAHPGLRHFAYESVGCAWGVVDNRGFKRLFEISTGVRFSSLSAPDPGTFIARFPNEVRPLLSHGYGRTLYFVHRSLARSLKAALATTSLNTRAAVHGVAFAYAMINFADLGQVLEVRPDLRRPALNEAFVNGLAFALAMWSWTFPGFLRGLTPQSNRQIELMERAERILSQSRKSSHFSSPDLSPEEGD